MIITSLSLISLVKVLIFQRKQYLCQEFKFGECNKWIILPDVFYQVIGKLLSHYMKIPFIVCFL